MAYKARRAEKRLVVFPAAKGLDLLSLHKRLVTAKLTSAGPNVTILKLLHRASIGKVDGLTGPIAGTLTMNRLHRQFAMIGLLLAGALACAQPVPRLSNMTPALSLVPPSMITPVKPCVHPIEPFDIDDYNGPLSQVVGRFSQRLESTTVHIPRHKSDLRPCALSASDKFHMFVESTSDPLNYVGAAWDAATAQIG